MLNLPHTSAAPGSMLAAYLAADPARRWVAEYIHARLEPCGSVGDTARYYIVRTRFRRAVFRGILIASGMTVPAWAKESPEASASNSEFIAAHREQYLGFRRDCRGGPVSSPLADALRQAVSNAV